MTTSIPMKLAAKISLILTALGLSFVLVLAPVVYGAGLFDKSIDEACKGAQVSNSATADTCTKPAQTSFNALLKTIINIFSIVIGIVAVIMIMVSGFRYITSGGDSNGISAAKGTLLYAVVGLVIVALAQFIVKFVLNKATG